MRRTLLLAVVCGLAVFSRDVASPAEEITTGTLLKEMADLDRLARWPDPPFRTVQFSSYDRRSTTVDAPGWFSNADGFGGEPIPGFQQVLREPRDGEAGLFLLADVKGPGAIVRGWSAGMGGTLKVYLDPEGEPAASEGTLIYAGPAYEFLARRSAGYMAQSGCDLDADDAFIQQDADYLPIPFARGLRVTWEGRLNELHFYHLQVRLYPEGTAVRSFDPRKDLQEFDAPLRSAAAGLVQPSAGEQGEVMKIEGTIEPGRRLNWSNPGPGAVRELKIRLSADSLDDALRGCVLRIAFDGSQRPQVEAPVGDFFASGPGVNPFSSLPLSVEADGTLACRFVMPFEKSVSLEVVNTTAAPVSFVASVRIAPWQWDERSLHFRARWRVDHDLAAGTGVTDMPYVVAVGKGVFAGCAVMVMNPSGAPMAGGNWWGEGDEKILVDGETVPSTFGTGSEDYFNYSWSRPDLFDHPYCGQPLDSGPDTSGYVSNHRFQVTDAIPFQTSLAASLELWTHNPTPGLSYARIAYLYARPGMTDDHRTLMPSELKVPVLPKREPIAVGGASGAKFYFVEPLHPEATAGRVETVSERLATRHQVVLWHAEKGGRLTFRLPVTKDGRAAIHLVALHQPAGGVVRALVDGRALRVEGGAESIALRSAHAPRVLNVHFEPVDVKAGSCELTLECIEAGPVGLDYVWVKEL